MRSGRLRHTLELQERTSVRDASGGESETWLTIDKLRASLDPLSAREQLLADQVQGDVSHRIRTRYHGEITAKHRFKLGSRVFNILPPRNVNERNHEMEILANEEV